MSVWRTLLLVREVVCSILGCGTVYKTLSYNLMYPLMQAEYKKLTQQLSEYSVKLLGQVRSGRELDIILRESTHREDTDRLARLKLAIRYGEKPVR